MKTYILFIRNLLWTKLDPKILLFAEISLETFSIGDQAFNWI